MTTDNFWDRWDEIKDGENLADNLEELIEVLNEKPEETTEEKT